MLSLQPEKETNRTRAVLGDNLVHIPDDVGTPTADMMLFKILLNSVISTPEAKFMTINISNFYLNTPKTRYKYVKMRLADTSNEVVQEYNLHESGQVKSDGFVYAEVRKGMYDLLQAGKLAQKLLEKRLSDQRYF